MCMNLAVRDEIELMRINSPIAHGFSTFFPKVLYVAFHNLAGMNLRINYLEASSTVI